MSAMAVSGVIFAVTLVLILSERMHRTIAAIVGAVAMVALGMAMGFYSQEAALAAIDFNTLGLLFGMMILVSMLRKTGFFEYLAIVTARRSGGAPWQLFVFLGTVTTVASLFLDNATTVILIAPVTLLIVEILGLNPIPFLMAEALLSNTGGVGTLVGDPPNIMIASAANLSFNDFLTHLLPLVFVAWLVVLLVLGFIFRRELSQRPREIEALMRLNEREALHNPKALRRILSILGGVILLFFAHHRFHLTPAFIAIAGAAAALIWVRPDVEEILRGVEWSVLVFFAALFVLVGGLESSGLLGLVAGGITGPARHNLLLTSVAFIWIGAIVSAVVGNIPFTMIMIPIVQGLGVEGVNVSPVWWALALGAGFGGNGTPIASAASVIVVTFSEKTKTPITFRTWIRSGTLAMLTTCFVATILFVLAFGYMSR
jgi:Na+/H+ antiporter NhaD/arsenite permease-like protein